ncbi:MAG: 30S ribosomal protein S2 [Candidatus Pacebacteria bacterium CG2_30_36_39]|nr:MAG: 30S ribosomal protein S2 [Candidatus Pacebacteria bacterium CG2_30_36_39]
MDFSQYPDKAPDYDLRDLLEAGMHFGHNSAKWHPKMKEFIYMEKDGVHIFDLAKTASQLRLAYNFIYDMGAKGKKVLFLGTKRQARDIVREAAQGADALYIAQRWMGGMLTNWEQISKSVKRMVDIEKGLETGRFDGYTKFEKLQLEKEKGRLERFFEGVKTLKGKPDCLVVVDPKREKLAVIEAQKEGIPVVALIDSNTDPSTVSLPVPGNDDAVSSITLAMKEFAKAYAEGKKSSK